MKCYVMRKSKKKNLYKYKRDNIVFYIEKKDIFCQKYIEITGSRAIIELYKL